MTLNVTPAEHRAIMLLCHEMRHNREASWTNPLTGNVESRYSEYEEIIRLCAIVGVDTFQTVYDHERATGDEICLRVEPVVYQRVGVQMPGIPLFIQRRIEEGRAFWFNNVLIEKEALLV